MFILELQPHLYFQFWCRAAPGSLQVNLRQHLSSCCRQPDRLFSSSRDFVEGGDSLGSVESRQGLRICRPTKDCCDASSTPVEGTRGTDGRFGNRAGSAVVWHNVSYTSARLQCPSYKTEYNIISHFLRSLQWPFRNVPLRRILNYARMRGACPMDRHGHTTVRRE